MDNEIYMYGGAAFLALVLLYFIYRYIHNLPPVVTQEYQCEDGNFKVKGRMNNFIIKKDDNLEFLVQEGEIVALRDITKGKEFIYYKEKK